MQTNSQPLVSIGLVTLNGKKYLKNCLNSILKQDYPNVEILVVDNGSTDGTVDFLHKEFGQIKLETLNGNIGFAGGHNKAIRETTGKYYVAINQDTVLETNYISDIVKALENNEYIGSAQGKVKKLTFGRKSNIIDGIALKLRRSCQVSNLGEEEYDHGQYDEQREIFGVSGELPIYRRKALEDVSIISHNSIYGKEYFDETFFAYKEDVDLAWRLQIKKWKSLYIPKAVAYHDRSVSGNDSVNQGNLAIAKNRQTKSKLNRKLSFRNHHYLQMKNLFWGNYWRNFPEIAWHEIKMWGYALVFETFIIPDMVKVFSNMPLMLKKRKQIMKNKRATANDLQKWFT